MPLSVCYNVGPIQTIPNEVTNSLRGRGIDQRAPTTKIDFQFGAHCARGVPPAPYFRHGSHLAKFPSMARKSASPGLIFRNIMLFDGTFDVWFPTIATRVSAHFRSPHIHANIMAFHSRKFSSLWCEKVLYPLNGRKTSQPERTNDRIASSVSHTGADRFSGNERANYRLYNLEIEVAKEIACFHLVNRPGNSDCQPLGNIFNGGCPSIKLNRGPASHAIEYVLPRKAVRLFVDAEIANHRLMDPGIGLVNALRIALNLQLVEYDPRRTGRSWLGRGLVPFSGCSAYLFLPCLSLKCHICSKQSDSVSRAIE